MRHWTTSEYNVVFAEHPPTRPTAPTRAECEALGHRLGRSRSSIYAQWNDARARVLRQTNASSRQLRDYIRARGWDATRASHK